MATAVVVPTSCTPYSRRQPAVPRVVCGSSGIVAARPHARLQARPHGQLWKQANGAGLAPGQLQWLPHWQARRQQQWRGKGMGGCDVRRAAASNEHSHGDDSSSWSETIQDSSSSSSSSSSSILSPQSLSQSQLSSASSAASASAVVVDCTSMEDVYESLAHRLLAAARATTPPNKFVVALAGPPGAGKSTVSQAVVDRVNHAWRHALPHTTAAHADATAAAAAGAASGAAAGAGGDDVAAVAPMDGFHLYRWQLDAMDDPKEAHARRGAPWTFDPASLVDCLRTLKDQGTVSLPSFDHGVGDPVPNDIPIPPSVRVVVVEGNYLLLNDGDWARLQPLFDETWFVQVDLDEAMQRVEKRHVATGERHGTIFSSRPITCCCHLVPSHAAVISSHHMLLSSHPITWRHLIPSHIALCIISLCYLHWHRLLLIS
ncbi:unnamed protein product [Closterium sp. Naga37s-1]|nr:unnamed protein product [Closterium sp. Naga37s-1]